MQGLIRRRLCDGDFCSRLASFGSEPAIFYRKAPSDNELSDGNYPQIVFAFDKFSDAVRGAAGLLTLDIVCTQASTSPEELEPHVRRQLEGIFFAPDPIQTLNLWAARWDENAVIIGLSDFGDEFKPSRDEPAIYFDTQRIQLLSQSATAVFLSATVNAHVFAETVKARREWLTALKFGLLRTGTFRLEDGSPLRLTASELNFSASEVQGQLLLTFDFGVPKFMPYAHPLTDNRVNFDGRIRHVQA